MAKTYRQTPQHAQSCSRYEICEDVRGMSLPHSPCPHVRSYCNVSMVMMLHRLETLRNNTTQDLEGTAQVWMEKLALISDLIDVQRHH